MAKRYTQAEWARLQSRLPKEDRVPYNQSPDLPTPTYQAPEVIRNPITGLSPLQEEARAGLLEAQASRAAVGLPTGVITNTPGSAGRLDTPPKTGLKAGYEWYKFNLPGGGSEWRQRPTKETLAGAYTTIFSTNNPPGTTTPTGLTASQLASQSAFEVFRGFLRQYGIEGLAADVEKYKLEGLSDDELLVRLRTESAAYKRRFKANESRITKGLTALSEAEYIGLEDAYQDIMRRYGLPESYYARGEMGRQEGFEKFIAGDVSPTELETRVQTAQNRVLNAPTQIKDALTQFYGAEITNGDVLAYVLDPDRALSQIQRKVTAAEIGGAAAMAGLAAGRARAEELGAYGVTGAQAREGFQTVAGVLPRASMLGDIYAKQGLGEYTQTTAEQEVFGLTGAAEAQRKRQKLSALEQAQFAGSSGAAGGALSRERAGQF